jgi:toxin ParE1/3/4
MPKPEYRLSPKARDDMESVWLYTLSQWGHEQTEKYIDDLAVAFDLLTTNPRLGTRCDNIRAGYRKHPTLRHVIYFREVSYGIEIIRVLHDHQLAARHL